MVSKVASDASGSNLNISIIISFPNGMWRFRKHTLSSETPDIIKLKLSLAWLEESRSEEGLTALQLHCSQSLQQVHQCFFFSGYEWLSG